MYLISVLLGFFLLMGALAVDFSQQVSFFVEGVHFYCRDQRYGFFEDELIAYSLACFLENTLAGTYEYIFDDHDLKGVIRVEQREHERFLVTLHLIEGMDVVRERSFVIFRLPDGSITYSFHA